MTLLATERYRSKGTPGLGQLRTADAVMVFLKAKKAFSQALPHRDDSVFLGIL